MIYGRFRAKKKRYQNPSKSLKRLHSILRIGHSLKAVNIDPQAHILCSHSSLKTGGYLLRHEFFEHSSSMPKRRTPPRKSHWGVPLTIRLKPSSWDFWGEKRPPPAATHLHGSPTWTQTASSTHWLFEVFCPATGSFSWAWRGTKNSRISLRIGKLHIYPESEHQILMVQWLTFSDRWFIRKGVCKHGLVNFHVLGWHSSLILSDVRCWLNARTPFMQPDRR